MELPVGPAVAGDAPLPERQPRDQPAAAVVAELDRLAAGWRSAAAASRSPRASSTATPFGATWMPAPTSASAAGLLEDARPGRRAAPAPCAAARPPMPAPMTAIVRPARLMAVAPGSSGSD